MTPPVVVADASAMIAALADADTTGKWARRQFIGSTVAAPAVMPFEVANVLRRHELRGDLSPAQATAALHDLQRWPAELWSFELLATGMWALRGSMTAYDAAYVAVARLLAAPLLTLDTRLARAAAGLCEVVVP